MDQENRLTHNISTWKRRNPTCHIPTSLLSLQQSDYKLECNSPNKKNYDEIDDDDEKAKEEENKENGTARVEEITGRERLKRHREEMKGKVKVPENWEKEQKLKEWVDYTTFDALIFAPHALIVTARDALIADVRKSRSQRLRIHT
ncbi:protein BIC1 [Medicago truncatula]|uniref:protein BIC1 n=1 Tax=Medicago truncatula TaxID=3880 RepID=UPI000D2F1BD1|nr:protein BIC1 [Medicago truncatula]